MSVNAFPLAAAGDKTDEAGEIVLGEYKATEFAYIPASKLAVGSYYLTTAGAGTLSVFTYTGTSVGDKLVDLSLTSARTSNKLTVPSGVSGLYVTGTYLGSLIFQKINELSAPASVNETFVDAGTVIDFGAGNNWTPVDNDTNFFGEWNGSTPTGKPVLYNHTTGQRVRSSNFLYDQSGNYKNTPAFAKNGSTVVATAGYAGPSYNSYIWTSTDSGASYSLVHTLQGIDYNNIIQYGGGIFLVASRENGYGSGSSNYYTSPDGITWTTRTLPWAQTNTTIRYANGTWILFTSNGNTNDLYISTDGISWTAKTGPAFSNPIGIYNAAYVGTNFVLTNGNGKWYTTANFSSYSELYNGSYYRGGVGFDNSTPRLKNVAYYNGSVYFGGYDSNGYRMIISIDASLNMSAWNVYSGNGLNWPNNLVGSVFKLGSDLYGFAQNSPYPPHKLVVNSVSSYGGISGAPQYMPADDYNHIFFSKKFNYWYMSMNNGSVGVVRGATPGRSGFGKWTTVFGGIGSGMLIETSKSIGFTSAGYYYRSTDGVNFNSYSLPYPSGANLGAAVTPNGVIIIPSSTDRYINVSYDDGLSFSSYYLNSGQVEAFTVRRLSDGVYLCGTNGRKVYRTTNGSVFTDMAFSFPVSPKLHPANDCIIGYNSGTTWYKTLAGPVMGSVTFTVPQNWNGGSVVQFGSIFAYMPYTVNSTYYNAYWTSPNCITWTQRTLPSSKYWQYAYGSDSHLFVSTNYDDNNRQIDVQAISTTLTF